MALTYNEDGTTSYSIAQRKEALKKETRDKSDIEKLKEISGLKKRTEKRRNEK